MKIGVKYCGGCNPRYDRKGFYDKLRSLSDSQFHRACENEQYDLLLVINGCKCACCNIDGLSYGTLLWVDSSTGLSDVVKKIRRYEHVAG